MKARVDNIINILLRRTSIFSVLDFVERLSFYTDENTISYYDSNDPIVIETNKLRFPRLLRLKACFLAAVNFSIKYRAARRRHLRLPDTVAHRSNRVLKCPVIRPV